MNIFDFAMKMELDGKVYYEQMAAKSTQPELQSIFRMLAASEQEHHDALRAMRHGSEDEVVDERLLQDVRKVFKELLASRETFSDVSDPDGFRQMVSEEERSIRQYLDLAEREQNPQAKKLLLLIAEQEKRHLSIMENIYEFVESPKNYLAWGEFSNLTDL